MKGRIVLGALTALFVAGSLSFGCTQAKQGGDNPSAAPAAPATAAPAAPAPAAPAGEGTPSGQPSQ